jgi:hypothetical protein
MSKALEILICASLLWNVGCSGDPAKDRVHVGGEPGDGKVDGGSAIGSGAGQAGDGVDDDDNALHVHVEDPEHMKIEIITLRCAGDCADVEAVAAGGNAPYAFEWEDGSKAARRHVCPDASTSYSVTATDTAIDSDEFHYDAQQSEARVTAEVLDCAAVDGGSSEACLDNPSFEGPVTQNQFSAFAAPPWNACYTGGFITYAAIADASLWPTQQWDFPDASDGNTYLALGQQGALFGRASQTLCAPLHAGETRSFLIDLAHASSANASVEATDQVVQILGGTKECGESEVLWTSPKLSTQWTTHCVTLEPKQDTTTLGFKPVGTAGGGEMEGLVDHLVPVANCP